MKRMMSMNVLRQGWWLIVMLATLLVTGQLFAAGNVTPLPIDKAFAFSVDVKNPHEVIAKWQIAKGYYLYRDRFRMTAIPGTETQVQFPKGTMHQSIERGSYEIYTGQLELPITLKSSESSQLIVHYQGCSEAGFCYPP